MIEEQAPSPLSDDYLKAHASDPEVVPYLTSEERRRLSRLMPARSGQRPLKEETTYAGGFLKSAEETVGRTAKGMLQGAAGLIDPRTYAGVLQQGARMLSNPAMGAVDSAVQGQAFIDEAGRVLSGDPEAGGRVLGQIVAGKLIPVAAEQVRGMPLPSMPSMGGIARGAAQAYRFARHPVREGAKIVADAVEARVGRPTPAAPAPAAPVEAPPPPAPAPAPAASPAATPPATAPAASRSAKPKAKPAARRSTPPSEAEAAQAPLSLEEERVAKQWAAQGVPVEVILSRIVKSRQLTQSMKTPTPDKVAERVKARNANPHGKWED